MRLQRFAPILIFITSHVIGCSGGAGLDTAAGVSDLSLSVLPESMVDGGRAESFTLAPQSTPQGLAAVVRVAGAQGLKALYLEVEYDPQRLEFSGARATDELCGGRAGGVIELALELAPGRVVYGQVLCNYDEQSGFSGDGELAVLSFVPRSSGAPVPANAARTMSLAPATDASQAPLHLDVGAATLDWRYYCQGDTDQNGEVNIADLTPIGLHFGEAGPFGPLSILSVVDADANGEINAADVTPIGLNYERRVSGYRIYGSDDPADYPASNDAVSSIDWLGVAGDAAGDRAAERLHYSFDLGALDLGFSYWVRPFDGAPMQADANEGTPSNMVSGADPGNEPPKAELAANPAFGPAPLRVRLYAGNSTDDGTIVLYEWDLDGDAVFETTEDDPLASVTFDTPGEHIIALRVTDDSGLTDTNGVLVVADAVPGWDAALPRDFVSEPEHALAVIDGRPALAWKFGNPHYYSRASDAAGLSWPAEVAIDTGGLTMQPGLVLAEVDHQPAVSFMVGDTGVYYLRGTAPDGTAWGDVHQAVAAADCRSLALLSAPGEVPLIAFFIGGAVDSLRTVTGQNADGSLWRMMQLADEGPLGFTPADLAVIISEPALAYTDELDQLIYSRGTEVAQGYEWVNEVIVEPGAEFNAQCTLREVDQRPALAYCTAGATIELHYVRANDPLGLLWGDPVAVAPGSNVVARPQLLLSGGLPLIVYVDGGPEGTHAALMSVAATDELGADWAAPQELCRFDGIPWMDSVELAGGGAGVALVASFDHDEDALDFSVLYFLSQQ